MVNATAGAAGLVEAVRKITRALAMVGVGIMFFTTLVVVADVTGRYLLGKPIPGVTESLGILSAWIIFPALAWALFTAHHVRVTLLVQRLPTKGQQILDCLASLIGVVVLGIMTYFAILFFWESFLKMEFMMSRIFVPLWLGKLVLPIGFLMFFVLFTLRLLVKVGNMTGLLAVSPERLEEKEEITE